MSASALNEWVVPVASLGVMVVGLGVNLFVMGRFVGEWSTVLKTVVSDLAEVDRRIEAVERAADDASKVAAASGAETELRLQSAEKATHAMWEVRDKVTEMRASSDVENRYQREKLDSVGRSVAGIERQIATLVTHGVQGVGLLEPRGRRHGPQDDQG